MLIYQRVYLRVIALLIGDWGFDCFNDDCNTNGHPPEMGDSVYHPFMVILEDGFCLIMHVPMQCTRIFTPSASPKDQRGYTCCLLHESPGPCGSFLVGYSLPDSFGTHLLPSSAWQLLCLLSLGATSPPGSLEEVRISVSGPAAT